MAAAPAATEPAFDIWEYEIEGNSLLPIDEIERAVQPFLGPQRTMREVESARNALEAAFQKAGYLTALVDIPEQRVDEGVVRLVVLEGRLGQLYVTGSRYHAQGAIRQALPALVPGSVPNFTDVQQQLGALNRNDDRRVQPVIKPGRVPGTVDMELQVADKLPWGGSVELNNQHSAGTVPMRASATLHYDNLLQLDHSIALTLQTAPAEPRQSRVAVLNYTIPLPEGDNWTLSLTGSNSDVETLGGTQALGRGTTWGVRRAFNLSAAGSSHTVTVGADLKRLKDSILAGAASIDTPLHYLPLQLGWVGNWNQGAESLTLNTSLTAAWRRILQARVDCAGLPDDQFACKSQGASGSFSVLKLDGRWSLPLAGGSLGALNTRLATQFASGPLVSAEQFSLGGAETVRGYFESSVSADRALLGSLEWRSANFAADMGEGWIELRPLLFADIARGYLIQPATGQSEYSSLASAGFGLRANAHGLEGALDFAWPAVRTPNTAPGALRLHARLTARY